MTNPLEITSYEVIRQQLCSESVILVRRQDIINRWTDSTDLSPLMTNQDPIWKTANILGKFVYVSWGIGTSHWLNSVIRPWHIWGLIVIEKINGLQNTCLTLQHCAHYLYKHIVAGVWLAAKKPIHFVI